MKDQLKELTAREKEIVRLAGAAIMQKQIAGELKIASGTLNTHMKSIHLKTGTRSMAELALWTRDNPDKLV